MIPFSLGYPVAFPTTPNNRYKTQNKAYYAPASPVDTFSRNGTNERKPQRFIKSDIPYWLGGSLAASGTMISPNLCYGKVLAFGGVILTLSKGAYDYKNI